MAVYAQLLGGRQQRETLLRSTYFDSFCIFPTCCVPPGCVPQASVRIAVAAIMMIVRITTT